MSTLEERIAAKTRVAPSGCHEWTGARMSSGYGYLRVGGRNVGAHRAALMLREAPPAATSVAMHSRDNRTCVNPAHLSWGTQSQNLLDCAARGRHKRVALAGERHPSAVLTDEQAAEILRRYTGRRGEQAALAAEFGVSRPVVHKLVHGHRKRPAA
jgi:hypothetical protein